MSLALMIYLANVSGNLGHFTGIVTAVLCATTIVLWIIVGVATADKAEEVVKSFKRPAIVTFCLAMVFGIVTMFLPSQKTVYLIMGAEAATSVAQSPQAQQLLSKIEAVVNKKLDDELKASAK